MQHKQRDYDDDDFAEIWRSAQHRRTEDIYLWFTHWFRRQRQLKPSDSRLRYPQRPATAGLETPGCEPGGVADGLLN